MGRDYLKQKELGTVAGQVKHGLLNVARPSRYGTFATKMQLDIVFIVIPSVVDSHRFDADPDPEPTLF